MKHTLLTTTLLATTLLTSACTQQRANDINFTKNLSNNHGVEIARTAMQGPSGALTTTGLTEDCAGPGLGIKVEGTTNTDHFLFDSDGNPCDASTEIFNGRDAIHQRPTDATSVQIGFKDAFGSTAPTQGGSEVAPIVMHSSQTTTSTLPEDYATAPTGVTLNTDDVQFPEEQPGLAGTINAWETARERQRMAAERQQVLAKSSQTLASMRELDQLTSRELIAAQHDKLLELMARLRDAERQIELEQQRHQTTLKAADNTRNVAEAKITSWQQKEDQLNAEKSALQARLGAFESLSQRLAQEKKNKELAYQNRVQTLEEQLQQSEQEANQVRKELVLEAAQKIAEAERLAYAARLAEQEAKKREAERLKMEGQQLMARASELKSGGAIMVPRMADMFDPLSAQTNTTPQMPLVPLADVPITINVKDKPLNQIVADIFQNVRTVSGNWQVDWQLSGTAQYLLEETWTLTAEARFTDIMAHIQKTVQQQNGITLTFRQFEKSRLFVISDE